MPQWWQSYKGTGRGTVLYPSYGHSHDLTELNATRSERVLEASIRAYHPSSSIENLPLPKCMSTKVL
jgi:hypothetical protein